MSDYTGRPDRASRGLSPHTGRTPWTRVIAGVVAATIAILGLGISTPARADEPPRFVSTWKTDELSAGSSSDNQVTLPLVADGDYDFVVDWGDSSTSTITTETDPQTTHTYGSAGTYTITITGTISGFRFNNSGDRRKLTGVSEWGPLALGATPGGQFYGAQNLTITAADAPSLTGTTDLSNAFNGATTLTGGVAGWNVSGVTTMRSMFQGATDFNADIAAWNVANVTTMRSMFQGATDFNADIAAWNVANVTTMRSMFQGATGFDRDLGGWNVQNVADMTDMFAGGDAVGLSLDNYDSLLEGWAQQVVQPGVDFYAGDETYYNPKAELPFAQARQTLINDYAWTITDAGAAGVPARPNPPSATPGSNEMTLTWTEPADNHSSVQSYAVTAYSGSSETEVGTCTAESPELSCTVTGLENDLPYTAEVAATNAVGSSPWSNRSAAVTPQTTVPGPPRAPVVAALDGSAQAWITRGQTGGTPDTFRVTAFHGSDAAGTCQVAATANATCTVTGLTNGQNYTFTAAAQNSFSEGLWSDESSASETISPTVPLTMRWDTTKTTDGSTGDRQIRLPLVSDGTYSMRVAWGDGTVSEIDAGNDTDRTHTYSTSGVKDVTITGGIRGWSFGASSCDWNTGSGDRNKLLEISKWGSNPMRLDSPTETDYYFCNADNLTITAIDSPNLTLTTSLKGAFMGADNFNNSLANWNVSGVSNMSYMFYSATRFNQPLEGWDTGSVQNMSYMFSRSPWIGAGAFNQSLSEWDTSAVTNMQSMFADANNFAGDLSGWDTSAVTNMQSLFNGATRFNSDISNWDTAEVTTMAYMFQGAAAFDQDLSTSGDLWNTAKVTSMVQMFNGATAFDGDIANWNVTLLTNMQYMFANTQAFNGDLSSWNVANVTNMTGMFQAATAFNSPLNGWGSKTGSVTSTRQMFLNATVFNQPLDGWDVADVTDMYRMFYGATAFDQDLNSWRPDSVSTMSGMFGGASAFDGQISDWTVGHVTSFEGFLAGATSFNQDIGDWDTSTVTDMANMFNGASAFNQDLRSWDMGGVTTAAAMLNATALSTANYNKMLYSWANGSASDGVANGSGTGVVTDDVVFGASPTKYSEGLPASARAALVERGWQITDGGLTNGNVPQPPTDVNGTGDGSTRDVAWTAPALRPSPATNPPITSYTATAYQGTPPALTSTGRTCTTAETSCQITGLAEGTYYFSVVATNAVGDSDPSQMQAPAQPPAPVAQSRNGGVKVGWIPQPTTGGDPISYEISATPSSQTCTITLPDKTCPINGLTNGVDYTFSATATNAFGTSEPSPESASVSPGSAFVSTWRTNNAGISTPRQITLPLANTAGNDYDLTVLWGDGTSDTINGFGDLGKATHTYPARGDYDVTITGTIKGWRFANGGDRTKIVDISEWGPLRLGNGGRYFQGASRLRVSATDELVLGDTTDLSQAFSGATRFNGAIGNWNTSNVTTMASMFSNADAFDQPLVDWDTGSVTDMSQMFYSANVFDQSLEDWDVDHVLTFSQMFSSTNAFDGSVSGWNPTAATNLSQMFSSTRAFNQPIDWATTNATNLSQMFYDADAFNSPISLSTGNVTTMASMFAFAELFDQSVSAWNTGSVTTMAQMFNRATAFNNGGSETIDDWNTGNVTTMSQMFSYSSFNQPIGGWDTSKVTDLSYMFQYDSAFDQELNAWDTSKVTTMYKMFEGASSFDQDLDHWSTVSVTGSGLGDMFYLATAFDGQIGTWNTSKVTTLANMLYGTSFNQDVSGWQTGNVTNFQQMFYNSRFRGDVTRWNVTKATDMTNMFGAIRPPTNWRAFRGTPWVNRILVAWAAQNVKTDVRLDFSDTGYTYESNNASTFPRYTIGAFSNGAEAAHTTLTSSKSPPLGQTAGKDWDIYIGGTRPGRTTLVNAPGTPLDVWMERTGGEGGEYGNGTEATVHWSKPTAGDTSADITYTVQSTTDAEVGCTVEEDYSCTINQGLETDEFHQFTVTASNETGDSDPTSPLPTLKPLGFTFTLDEAEPTADGFRVHIPEYDTQYQWSGSATEDGSVTFDDDTKTAIVSGLDPHTTSQATITATKFGFDAYDAQASGTSLFAKLDPTLGPVTRTPQGYRFTIANFADLTGYSLSVSTDNGDVIRDGAEVTVSNLGDGEPAAVTVHSDKDGYDQGTLIVTRNALDPRLDFSLTDVTRTSDGFEATISEYELGYTWAASVVVGEEDPTTCTIASGGTCAFVAVDGGYKVVVSGLPPNTGASLTVAATKPGESLDAEESTTSRSLESALDYSLTAPARRADGFEAQITGYDDEYEWSASVAVEGEEPTTCTAAESSASCEFVEQEGQQWIRVIGLAPETEATVTVTAGKPGIAEDGVQSLTESALLAARVPSLAEDRVTRTPTGFTATIDNYDDGTDFTWSWEMEADEGDLSYTVVGGDLILTVTGLEPQDSASIVVTTTAPDHADGERTITGVSQKRAVVPELVALGRTSDGFTFTITNRASGDGPGFEGENYDWTFESPGLPVTGSVDGDTVTVHGVAPGTEATVAVVTTRLGTDAGDYAPGRQTISGTALTDAPEFSIGEATSTDHGFEAPLEGWAADDPYTWNVTIPSDGDPDTDETVVIEDREGDGWVVVDGLSPDTTTTATVTAEQTGESDQAERTVTGTSLKAALVPVLVDGERVDNGFSFLIDNYNGEGYTGSDYTWDITTDPVLDPSQIERIDDVVTVSGLAAQDEVLVTVRTTRTGSDEYAQGSQTYLGSALDAALDFEVGSVVRRIGGFQAPIVGFDDSYEWLATVTSDSDTLGTCTPDEDGDACAFVVQDDTTLIRITGLADGQEATVTLTAGKPGIAREASDTATDSALDAALAFTLDEGNVEREVGGFLVPITGWAPGFDWSGTVTDGEGQPIADTEVVFNDEGDTHTVTVTGLADGDEATVTVTASNTGIARDANDTATSSALDAALDFEVGSVVRRIGGFQAPIVGFDGSYEWLATVTSDSDTLGTCTPDEDGDACAFVVQDDTTLIRITGLADGQEATVTLTAGKPGIAREASDTATDSALDAALAFTLDEGNVEREVGGFLVPITGWAPGFDWSGTVTDGEGQPIADTEVVFNDEGDTHTVTVTGLADGQEATVTVTASNTGIARDANDTATSSALEGAVVPLLVTPATRTANGFRAQISNYTSMIDDWTAELSDLSVGNEDATAIVEVVGDDAWVVVDDMVPGGTFATVRVITRDPDHAEGESLPLTGRSDLAQLTPVFAGDLDRQVYGFTGVVTNYDSDYEWSATLADGDGLPIEGAEVELTEGSSDSRRNVVVTGLADGQEAIVTVSTDTVTGPGEGVLGEGTVTGAALEGAYVPTLADPVPGNGSFTLAVTDYEENFDWTFLDQDGNPLPDDKVTLDTGGDTPQVSVNDLDDGEAFTFTVATDRTDYRQGLLEDVTGRSLLGALNPSFDNVSDGRVDLAGRTDGGFEVAIPNYDTDFDWTGLTIDSYANPDTGNGVITIQTRNDIRYLTVTGLADGQEATVTVTTTNPGYFDGTRTITGRALDPAYNPQLDTDAAIPGDGSFTVPVIDYQDNYDWHFTDTDGGDLPDRIQVSVVEDSGNASIRVSGLGVGEDLSFDVVTSRSGYLDGAASDVSGAALLAALEPHFGDVIRTLDGFEAQIINYHDSYTWSATVSDDDDPVTTESALVEERGDQGWVVVSGLGAGGGARVTATVETRRDDSFDGQATVRGRSILGALTPVFAGDLERQVYGFTGVVTNYDSDYEWSATLADGDGLPIEGAEVELTAGSSDSRRNVVVTGLADGQEARVTVSTDTVSGPGEGVLGEGTVTGAALEGAYVPTLADPVPGNGSFTLAVTDYEENFDWTFLDQDGNPLPDDKVTLDTGGDTPQVSVNDLDDGEAFTFTVATDRTDYRQGLLEDVTGRSLREALNPSFDNVSDGRVDLAGRTDGGFEVAIPNYDTDFDWTGLTIDSYANPDTGDGVIAIQNRNDIRYLTVTGLADGQEATVTVTTTNPGYFDGTRTITGRALDPAYNPQFDTAIPGDGSFTVPIIDYQDNYDWQFSDDRASLQTEGDQHFVVVTDLDPEEAVDLTVTTTRAGHLDGSGEMDGQALIGRALDPNLVDVTPTGDGLIATIQNYDPAFTWTTTPTLGSAEIENRNGSRVLIVSEVDPDTDVSVTIATSRTHYLPGSTTTEVRTLNAALTPRFRNTTRLVGGHSIEISNYTSRYRWSASATAGTTTITDQGTVRVKGLRAGQTATLTVRTARSGYAEGRASIQISSLGAAITPRFSTITRTAGGFRVQVRNFNRAFSWRVSAAKGTASISRSGLVTVSGLLPGTGSTATVTVERAGNESASSSVRGQALVAIPQASLPTAPIIKKLKAKRGGRIIVSYAAAAGESTVIDATATCKAGGTKKKVTGTKSPLRLKGLAKGKRFSCTVQVRNIKGKSPVSKPKTVKTK